MSENQDIPPTVQAQPPAPKPLTIDEKRKLRAEVLQKVAKIRSQMPNEGRTLRDSSQRDAQIAVEQNLQHDFEQTEKQVERTREPAMIEAEAVRDIAHALHHPDRREALLHTHLPQNVLAPMGELEAIERDAVALYAGQLEELARMLVDEVTSPKRIDEQKKLIYRNALHLDGMMKGIDDAFELAFAAHEGKRAGHGVQNISSVVTGAKSTPNFEDEGIKSLWRKLTERKQRGE